MDRGGSDLLMSRPFAAGAFTFLVGSPRRDLTELVERAFRDLPAPALSGDDMSFFVLAPSPGPEEPPRFELAGPVVGSLSSLTLPGALTMLMMAVSRGMLDSEPGYLHLHAAGAVRHGRAAVLSAPRETGKTTTLAHLVLRGWGFISDEALAIRPDDSHVHGFPKPLSIKPSGRTLLPQLTPHLLPDTGVDDDSVLHVALGSVGATVCEEADPALIVLLRRSPEPDADQRSRWRPVHPADAVVRLMTETMDAGRFGPRAVVELARLAARCQCCELVVGEPEDAAQTIEELFDRPDEEALPIEELLEGRHIKPNVVSLLVGDRVVIHEQPEGRILALDRPATQIWLTIGGWPVDEHIDLSGPVVGPFVDRLHALGLLDDAALTDREAT